MKVATLLAVVAVTAVQAAAVAEADPNYRSHWSSCGFPGVTCAKTKRAALAVAEALAEAEPNYRSHWSSCGFPGVTCAKARRSLEHLGGVTEKTLDNVFKLDKDQDAMNHRNKLIHTGFPSTARVSKREADPNYRSHWSSCGFAGITCAKAKRGIELMKEDFPNMHKEECFAEGGECHTILKARAAFDDAVKREAGFTHTKIVDKRDPNYRKGWSSCGFRGITCARDVYELAEAKSNGDPAAAKAEEECNGPNGDCTKAEAYFQELDAALTKATEQVLKDNQ